MSLSAFQRIPLFWRWNFALWLVYGIGSFPAHYIVIKRSMQMWEPTPGNIVAYCSMSIVASFAITSVMRSIFRPLQIRSIILGIAFIASLAWLATLLKTKLIDPALYNSIAEYRKDLVTTNQTIFTLWYHWGMYSVWGLLYFLARGYVADRNKARLLYESEAAQREAEIRMLRAQINPHFLFNALNTIMADVDSDSNTGRLTLGLSEYFRYSLANRSKMFVSLGEEIDATLSYLKVEAVRYGDRLQVKVDIDPGCRKFPVPGVFIQPLVENAIKHGRETSDHPLLIEISAKLDETRLVFSVSNTGSWREPQISQPENPSGLGLENLRRRLELQYPQNHHFHIEEKQGKVVAQITINDPTAPLTDTTNEKTPFSADRDY